MTDSQPQQSWLTRRNLLKIGAAGAVGLGLSEYLRFGNPAARANPGAQVVFWESPYSSTPVPEGVLFGFDPNAFPSNRMNVTTSLQGAARHIVNPTDPPEQQHNIVLPTRADLWDAGITFFGAVRKVDDPAKPFRLWYIATDDVWQHICVAESADGLVWDRPDLGLIAWNSQGSNICPFPGLTQGGTPASPQEGCIQIMTVLYEPEDSTNPYKMIYDWIPECDFQQGSEPRIAYSSDGNTWTAGPTPTGLFPTTGQAQGLTKFNGTYYANGHNSDPRTLKTYSSTNFTSWMEELGGNPGFDRSDQGQCPPEAPGGCTEQVHIGAALWNRNNVVVGIYDQWHQPPEGSGDPCPPPFDKNEQCDATIDLGLIVSYDAVTFQEPDPAFQVQRAVDQTDDPYPHPKSITKGQAIENSDDRTLVYFGPFHLVNGGVRLATWELDRLGQLRLAAAGDAVAESTLVEVTTGPASLYVNASGLAADATLRINLVDAAGAEIVGWKDAVLNADNGFAQLVSGATFAAELPTATPFRAQVNFEGASAENINLHAIYVRE